MKSINRLSDTQRHELAINSLKKVLDPEVLINVIDLGLIYKIDFPGTDCIVVHMTLSTPNCPLGESLVHAVRNTLADSFPTFSVEVLLVWEPVWTFEKVSAEGLKALSL